MKGQRFALHRVGLQHFGEGLSEQRALGCFRFRQIWLLFVFCRCFRTGCQSQARGGGSACFALALRSPGCGCFCLRLDFQVTVSVRGSQGSQPLVLAFSTRTLKSSGFRQDECRPGASASACRIPACPGLLVVVGFSCGPPLLLFGELLSSRSPCG